MQYRLLLTKNGTGILMSVFIHLFYQSFQKEAYSIQIYMPFYVCMCLTTTVYEPNLIIALSESYVILFILQIRLETPYRIQRGPRCDVRQVVS